MSQDLEKAMYPSSSWMVELQELPAGYLPFELEIDRIYKAYRTCYSKEPWTIHEISTQEENELLVKYRRHLTFTHQFYEGDEISESRAIEIHNKVNNQINSELEEFGMKRLAPYLYKADFIKRHMHHLSPVEHASITLTIECDRSTSHQLVRHRLVGISQQSQRYVDMRSPELALPFKFNDDARTIAKQFLNQLPNVMQALKDLGYNNDDIRSVLPNCTKTRLVMTANWREWMHIFDERRCSRASVNMRDIMNSAYHLVIEKVPFIFDDISPKCRTLGKCPEDRPCVMFGKAGYGLWAADVDDMNEKFRNKK